MNKILSATSKRPDGSIVKWNIQGVNPNATERDAARFIAKLSELSLNQLETSQAKSTRDVDFVLED